METASVPRQWLAYALGGTCIIALWVVAAAIAESVWGLSLFVVGLALVALLCAVHLWGRRVGVA